MRTTYNKLFLITIFGYFYNYSIYIFLLRKLSAFLLILPFIFTSICCLAVQCLHLSMKQPHKDERAYSRESGMSAADKTK